MAQISKEHTEFIRLVSDGVSQKEAYRVSVGKKGVSDATCEVKSSILAKKYAKEIKSERKKTSDIVDVINEKKTQENASIRVLSKIERMGSLTGIAVAGLEESNNSDKVKAIAELNKMDGSYAPTQVKSENTTTINWSESKTYGSHEKTN